MSTEQTLTIEKCVVCGAAAGGEKLATFAHGSVLSCKNCDTHSFTPQPTCEELVAAYQNFDAGQIAREEFASYVTQAKVILRSDFGTAGVPLNQGSRFLDYGCGGGHFVKAASELGLDSFGMDVDEESRRFGKKQGLRIEAGDYRDLQRKFGDKHFDVVFMMHVLEHIPRPSDALGAIIDMISPGGLLIIRVPDQDSLPSRIKRVIRLFGIKTQEWGFVQPPIHLHGYSIRTFKALAKAHQLEIVRLEKTSPLDELNFPATARYWHGLQIQRQIYKLGESFGSGGHLAAVFQRTH